jgi:menaquinone-9 beta-reductase
VLAEKLLSANDWDAAAHSYAEDRDRYFNVTREVGQWFFDLFLARGPEYDRLRERALPRLVTEPDRARIMYGVVPRCPSTTKRSANVSMPKSNA